MRHTIPHQRLLLACSIALSALLSGCATIHSQSDTGTGIGNYQFDYRVSSPSGIAAQVFSGQTHTYVSLPHGVQLQAATGNGQLYTPRKHGPYWEVSALAPHWSFATTRGIVNAKATGAALAIAQVDHAAAVVQNTEPLPAKNASRTPSATPLVATSPVSSPALLSTSVASSLPARSSAPIPAHHKAAHGFSTPKSWLSGAAIGMTKTTAKPVQHHEAILIPGSEGRFLPLRKALHRIAPLGWSVAVGENVSPSMPVFWHKGPWTESLDRMARNNLLVPHIDWARQSVRVAASPALLVGIPGTPSAASTAAPLQPPVNQHGPKSRGTHSVTTATKAPTFAIPVQTAPAPITSPVTAPVITPAPVASIFVATRHQMLSHDLRMFLKKQSWHLAWNVTKDWPITVSYALHGSVQDVLKKLMKLYPIAITGDVVNRTVVVTPATRF